MPQAIVTGGSGFVGTHLIEQLIREGLYDTIINVDIQPPERAYKNGSIKMHYLNRDLRKKLDADAFRELGCGEDTVIFNLAAICRIPGFPAIDYFRTNIKGAEHSCELAEELGCRKMVFTSSIAPYGASEEKKTEESIPQPDNPYGSSKLTAEYIHRGWYGKDPASRSLTILRPGIIFGRGEQANFTRLYESLKKGLFVYPGRKDTRKACIYVKDVVRACSYFARENEKIQLLNLVYEQAPTIEQICSVISRNTDAGRARIVIPGGLLIAAAALIQILGRLTGKKLMGIHPDRVRKVMISTDISGLRLAQTDFKLNYTLEEGICEWHQECGGILE